jgi:hypothetical protein
MTQAKCSVGHHRSKETDECVRNKCMDNSMKRCVSGSKIYDESQYNGRRCPNKSRRTCIATNQVNIPQVELHRHHTKSQKNLYVPDAESLAKKEKMIEEVLRRNEQRNDKRKGVKDARLTKFLQKSPAQREKLIDEIINRNRRFREKRQSSAAIIEPSNKPTLINQIMNRIGPFITVKAKSKSISNRMGAFTTVKAKSKSKSPPPIFNRIGPFTIKSKTNSAKFRMAQLPGISPVMVDRYDRNMRLAAESADQRIGLTRKPERRRTPTPVSPSPKGLFGFFNAFLGNPGPSAPKTAKKRRTRRK